MLVVHSKKNALKINVVSDGIAQLIDYLSENYHMKFVIVSTGTHYWAKDLADGILRHSKFSAEVRHFDVINTTTLINFDESCLVLAKDHLIIPDFFSTTNKSTFHRKMTLTFALELDDDNVKYIIEFSGDFINTTCPHDFYQLAHSPENGSMWLMGNELFYQKTCDSFYHPFNFFNSSSMKWKTSKFFNRYLTFHDCGVSAATDHPLADKYNQYHIELQVKNKKFLAIILAVFSERHKIVFIDASIWFNVFRKSHLQDLTLKNIADPATKKLTIIGYK